MTNLTCHKRKRSGDAERSPTPHSSMVHEDILQYTAYKVKRFRHTYTRTFKQYYILILYSTTMEIKHF